MSAEQNLNYFTPEDGVVLQGVINPKPRIHNGLKFSYRPCDPIERNTLSYRISKLKAEDKFEDAIRLEFTETMSRIASWSMGCELAAVKAGTVKINAELYNDIYQVVWIFQGPDQLEAISKNS